MIVFLPGEAQLKDHVHAAGSIRHLPDFSAVEYGDIVGVGGLVVVRHLVHTPLVVDDWLCPFSRGDVIQMRLQFVREHKLEHHTTAEVKSLFRVMHVY